MFLLLSFYIGVHGYRGLSLVGFLSIAVTPERLRESENITTASTDKVPSRKQVTFQCLVSYLFKVVPII